MFHDYELNEQSKAWMAELRADGDSIRRGRAARPERVDEPKQPRRRVWGFVMGRLRTAHA